MIFSHINIFTTFPLKFLVKLSQSLNTYLPEAHRTEPGYPIPSPIILSEVLAENNSRNYHLPK